MVWDLCTSAGAIRKAGKYASATITASAGALAAFYDDAEGDMITRTGRDWVTGYASIKAGVKKAIASVMENEIATRIINWNVNEWDLTSTQLKLNVLKNNSDITMDKLKEDAANDIRSVE